MGGITTSRLEGAKGGSYYQIGAVLECCSQPLGLSVEEAATANQLEGSQGKNSPFHFPLALCSSASTTCWSNPTRSQRARTVYLGQLSLAQGRVRKDGV